PGAIAWAEEETGLWLSSRSVGPDRLHTLLRVEEVGAGGDAIARLTELDERIELARRDRRLGPSAADPLEPLPLRRIFDEGQSVDGDTGLPLDLRELGSGLRGVALMRV